MYDDTKALEELAKEAKAMLQEQSAEDFNDEKETDVIYKMPSGFIPDLKIEKSPSASYYEQSWPKLDSYDKPIFPGGPLKSEVDSLKKLNAGYRLHVVEIDGDFFVFRTLNRFEYKQIVAMENTNPLQREEIICETVTLWPEEYNWKQMATDRAGLPSTYATVIMEKSGFIKDYSVQVL